MLLSVTDPGIGISPEQHEKLFTRFFRASTALALRGRAGAATFFPLRAVLFAPLWVFERSVSVYWALIRRLRGSDEPMRVAVPDRARGTRVASGE